MFKKHIIIVGFRRCLYLGSKTKLHNGHKKEYSCYFCRIFEEKSIAMKTIMANKTKNR